MTMNQAIAADRFKLTSVDLYITSVCNRRCGFCFLSDDFLGSRQLMPVDMARDVVAWARSGNVDEITILGGEPATHPGFADIVLDAKRQGRLVRTVTNGSRPMRRALRNPAVVEALDRVAVSIDAPTAADMDRLRGAGAFADALAVIESLRRAGIQFDINCTVLRSCLDTFPAMLTLAEDLGASRLNVHWFSAVGRGAMGVVDETVRADEWRDRVLQVVSRYQPQRPNFVVDCQLAYQFGLPGEDPTFCAVRGRENLQFFPNGAVFSCGLLVSDDAKSGYQWQEGGLFERPGQTEVTATAACSGCAFRAADGGYQPVCIYNRMLT